MDNEKHVDESWKDNVARDKEAPGAGEDKAGGSVDGCSCGHDHGQEDAPGAHGELEVNFFNYIMSLGYQAMIFLGEVPNPMTGKSEKNLRQAKFLIDTLALIKEKTRGNLSPEEDNILVSSLYELQMKYVELAQKGAAHD